MTAEQNKLATEAIKQLGAMGCEAIRQTAGLHSINLHHEAELMAIKASTIAEQMEAIAQGETVAVTEGND